MMNSIRKALPFVLILLWSHSAFAKSNLETSGDILHILIPATTFGATLLFEKGNHYEGSWQLIKTGVASRLFVEGLKATIHKQRPDHSANDAFPSGHAADTFAASTFIQQRYGWKWAIPAYLTSAYVGYTRVNSDKHQTSDVLAGAAIGIISGLYFTTPYKNVNIQPYADAKGSYGISLSSRF